MKPGSIDRVIDGVFLLTMPALALLAVLGHRGAAVVAGLSALAVALRTPIWREGLRMLTPARFARGPLPRAGLAFVLFAAWIAVTGFWSPTPGAAKLGFTVFAYALAGGALVFEASRADAARRNRMGVLFAGAVTIAAALLFFEGLTGGALRNLIPPADQSPERVKDMIALARGVTFIAPLAFPAAAIILTLTRSRLLAAAPVALALLAATQYSVAANVIAMLFGIGAAAAALVRPRPAIIAIGALFIFSFLAAPLFILTPADAVTSGEVAVLEPSWAQRAHMWREAADRILSTCWLAGCGADYTRAWAEEGVMISVPGSPIPIMEAPIHPHNVFLQVWLELGIVGLAAMLAAMWFGLKRLSMVEPERVAFAAIAGAAAASYISFMFEASLWQAWRLGVLALAAFGGALAYSARGKIL
jgi:O-antigen ligase